MKNSLPFFIQPPIKRVMTEAAKTSTLNENLRTLTDEIGGRVPGTPALKQAVDWSAKAFQLAGADSVVIEPYTIKMGWEEGNTTAEVISPEKFRVSARSYGWSPAFVTSAPANVIDIGMGTPEDFKKAGDISGSILLLHSNEMKTDNDLYDEYLDLPPILERAVNGKAAALAVMSTHPHNLMNRNMQASTDKLDILPIFQLAREDAQRVSRCLENNNKLAMMVNMPNLFTPEFTAWNVIAEIKGGDKAHEWALLGAHLDSWDLGTGALDNGCNVALVIDALRAIKASGVTPKRSIRFALFTGEEQGFLGSSAYVNAHHNEMDNAAGVVIFDYGSGAVTGYNLSGRKDLQKPLSTLNTPLSPLGVKEYTFDATVLTDNLSFVLEGVPNFIASQKTSNYLENYHAESDTFDKVDLPQLRKNVVIAAATTFAIANSPNHMKRQNLEETTTLLRDTTLDSQMKILDAWDLWTEIKAMRQRDAVTADKITYSH